ncbi:hypothetical protein A2631_02275 [Candidatus Daviesbacteria bacterium RIFCSPHIGHO2_01_FULL_44_29]|uniref:DUF3644 domain-containing protein n=1 Tax=Candidatus Daviesbacteria bacterium RIFCSPHIGHO2_02_FULL_43_12 TaxID=1797776 RepID=A0A1F5KK64_9BACT|nr:MAG: hypothetical protein A2631_02275 [Candidatus Daviesbacteria bacterium RIFCSPHIGHO2_01_FULL_44_29]OGE40996.1 MAG: hypothetical protein A3E86_03680 [Candidatus Daviesbacteria bacterium RIFCSPHIGHO2_12_FULL_47_45]OGE41219.1 MAG: hypothetical protein A3D25_01670 [Candidatus Daviesbacteria bacterium RIFCSPHIGHO2_02_FULL_43_12]OGE69419.1 MAG: hypothetical protein A3B55_03410 [Candidatus Daviesbacteria bacterium RIFCSPLOWO2_01_FULL_43_15]
MSRLSKQTRSLLDKARDSATQAISVFNDPRSTFRTGNFTVLMTIAWTALLHSYFEKKKIKYYYKQENGRFIKIDGDRKAWELGESVKQIFDENDPIKRNVELFIKLRNRIEHRNLPGIDQELTGECQALVLNFEGWLISQYGDEYSLIDTMFVPIQLTSAKRVLPKTKIEQKVIEFIKSYRNILTPEVINSQQYSFKAFLVPKIGNHRSSSDVAIEFVKYDENNPQEMEKYEKAIVAIKEKHIPVANTGLFRPSSVLVELNKRGIKKTMNWHTTMWQKFKVRPASNSKQKVQTKSEYCFYDNAHNDYLYTEGWIDFLVRQAEPKSRKKGIKPKFTKDLLGVI